MWPMKTDPEGSRRGACYECKRPETVDEVLISVTVSKSVAVCSQCITLEKYAKHVKAA